MRLIQFNRNSFIDLVSLGYSYIEIRQLIASDNSWLSDAKDLQILKALDRVDTLPASTVYHPVNSKAIQDFLSNESINYFILVDDTRVINTLNSS